MKHIAKLLLCTLLVAALLCGCTAEKAYTSGELTMTLPGYFLDLSDDPAAAEKEFLYGYKNVGIMGMKEEKSLLEEYYGELTVADYAQLLNEIGQYGQEITEKDGIVTFTYAAEAEGDNYTYITAFFESSEYFWTIQVYTLTSEYEKLSQDMWGYITTITIAE